ncbi:MAG TPA: SDR family NAD(P)-dependent oxidoreductase [Stellaceae bacterium]|nr:SDR family NAD(P)-dependent oxidoreductase [Stellaceae bacterium]
MNRLAGKVAVITGAGSGIGRASARLFVAEGAKVVVADIDEALGEASASEAGARFVRTDVTDDASVERMVRQAKDAFGRIDVLLNCAGGSLREDKPVTEVDLRVWDHTIGLDLKGPFLCCRHVIPVMVEQGKGSVVNFSSVVALRGNHIAHVYIMAKGGLVAVPQELRRAGAAPRAELRHVSTAAREWRTMAAVRIMPQRLTDLSASPSKARRMSGRPQAILLMKRY